jgi:hypothetical protein
MRYVAAVAALLVATACVGAEELQKATRVIEGKKTTFPAMTTPEGVKALTGVLESCIAMGDGSNTVDDLKKAQKGDHVRFVFSKPLKVEIMRKKLEVSEAVYGKGVFWLLCGKDVFWCSKYTPDKWTPFEKWYRQSLPAD